MKIILSGLFLALCLVPLRAEETPQAVYEINFRVEDHGVKPLLKAVQGGSPLRFGSDMWNIQGAVDSDAENQPIVRLSGLHPEFLYNEIMNRTTRYVLRGEIACNNTALRPSIQLTSDSNGQGETVLFAWKDERETRDGNLYWLPFELSCAIPPETEIKTLNIRVDGLPENGSASVFLRRLRLTEYGTPWPKEAEAIPAMPSIAELPTLSLHTLRTRAGLSWLGLAAGAGVAGGVLGGGALGLLLHWNRCRRQARHEAELQKIASLDAGGN